MIYCPLCFKKTGRQFRTYVTSTVELERNKQLRRRKCVRCKRTTEFIEGRRTARDKDTRERIID